VRVSYHVYLPAQYGQNERRRFPVVYWLHGSGGGVRGIERLAPCVDGAISAGRMQPLVVVFVNCLRNGMTASEARTMMRARGAIASVG
jgi:predicted peptidase